MTDYILSQEADRFYLFSKSYFDKKDIIDNKIITKENIQKICNTNEESKRLEILNAYIDVNTFVDKNKKKVDLQDNDYYKIQKIIIDCITNFNNCNYDPEDIENVKNLVQQKALNPIGDYIANVKNLLNSFIRKPKEFKNIWTKQTLETKLNEIFSFIKETQISLNVSSSYKPSEIQDAALYYELFGVSMLLLSIFNKIESEEELKARGITETKSIDVRENDMFDKKIEEIKKNNIYKKSNSEISYEIYSTIKRKYEETEKAKNKKKMIKYGLIGLGILLILLSCSSSIYYMKSNKRNLSSSGRRRKTL